MRTYTVSANREDGLWSAFVKYRPGRSFVGLDFQHLADVRSGVREALIDFLGTEDFPMSTVLEAD
ncbi:hypothetical protein WIS52_22540 [Pseudonocardia nematodicida]|uniref:HicB family protein n=1 Tax=Pseudonocardia nematodicida TaxID=1206997 RepID=A0ABV1KH63_9PSEU